MRSFLTLAFASAIALAHVPAAAAESANETGAASPPPLLLVGARGAALVPFGVLDQVAASKTAGAGGAVDVEAAYRAASLVSFGVLGQAAAFDGTGYDDSSGAHKWSFTSYAAAAFAELRAEKPEIFVRAGLGYRMVVKHEKYAPQTTKAPIGNSGSTSTSSSFYDGPEAFLESGVAFPVGSWLVTPSARLSAARMAQRDVVTGNAPGLFGIFTIGLRVAFPVASF